MTNNSSQNLESFVPVYDVVPELWDDSRPFLNEQLRKISNGVNIREIGWYLDIELLTGKAFIPGVNASPNTTPDIYREVFRKVVVYPTGLIAGANMVAHGITFDANFTLIDLWVPATNSTTFNAINLTDGSVTMDATNIIATSPGTYDRAYAIVEYLLQQ